MAAASTQAQTPPTASTGKAEETVPLPSIATVGTQVPAIQIPAPVPSKPAPNRPTNARVRASIGGRRLSDDFVQANTAGPSLDFEGEHRFSPILSARVSAGLVFNAGNATSVFTEEGRPFTGLIMDEAAVKLQATESLYLRGGVLRINFSSNPSIFAARGFPGLQQSYQLGPKRLNVTFNATQSMPTAGNVAQRFDREETVPHLFLHSVALNAGERNDRLSGSLSFTQFAFGDLSIVAAQDSRTAGNSVSGRGRASARFDYGFEGYETSFRLDSWLSRSFHVETRGSALVNIQAPDGSNVGWIATISPTWENAELAIRPEFGIYHNESDTLPASYTSTGVGQNNRHGPIVGVRTEFKKKNVTVSARWVQAHEIRDLPFTADRQIVTLGLETTYDLL